ncbi:MAG: hypothetical protein AAFX39_02570, partial [Pseudomonadota bacterium]
IGAPFADPNGVASAGSSYVVFGTSAGFADVLELSSLDGGNGFRINGENPNDLSGRMVSSAGDVNGDGIDDLIISAFGADPNGVLLAGSSYVVFGTSDGFADVLELSSLDGGNGFRINGENTNDRSSYSVSSAGDVNGDGVDDILISAPTAEANGNTFAGASYVVFGQAGGFADVLELSSLDGGNGFRVDGESADDRSGDSVSSAGDVNGDGFDDVIIGVRFADPNGQDQAGASYVVFGKSGGFADALDLSSLDGGNGFRINGETAGSASGYSVSSAGDVNGDGFDDVLIGAPAAEANGNTLAGASYVVFGQSGGFADALDLSSLGGSNGFRINGETADDESGTSVSAGDINGDGFSDIIIGALYADPNGTKSGASYVIYGRAPTTSVVRDGAAGDQTIRGGAFGDTLRGMGGDDWLYGADGDDELEGGTGADKLDGGTGDDRLDGSSGIDVLKGGLGNDTYVVDAWDTVTEKAGEGTDTVQADFSFTLGSHVENLRLTGTDSLTGTGNALANRIDGNSGHNTILGHAGDDDLRGADGDDRLDGGSGADTMRGGVGNDRYMVDDTGDRVIEGSDQGTDTVKASVSFALGSDVEHLTLTGTDDLDGTGNRSGNEIDGNSGANRLRGKGGDNVLDGRGGNDMLKGGSGLDQLIGGGGDDVLAGRKGADTLDGGRGGDTLRGGGGDDALSGESGQDELTGGGGDDVLSGGRGGDVLLGRSGQDSLTGGDGGDILRAGSGDDTLYGGKGDDEMRGGQGDDRLIGQGGDDVLNGGRGKDILSGGRGRDLFDFNRKDHSGTTDKSIDDIKDFSRTQKDKIDLRDLVKGKLDFAGDSPFLLGNKKQLRLEDTGDGIRVEIDFDGDRSIDFAIDIEGVGRLGKSDFLL